MPRPRQRLLKWTLSLLLRNSRRKFRRGIDPQRMRAEIRRFERLFARRMQVPVSGTVNLGRSTASWIDAVTPPPERVVLYLHGGAFITESPQLHGVLLARLCAAAGTRGFMVSYRLAPEHPYPAATDDCLAAYRYLLDNGYPSQRIAIAGDSAGGNLTLVTLQRARDEGLPLPAAAVCLSPVTDATFSGASYERNDDVDPLFPRSALEHLAEFYVPAELRSHPYVSPLFGNVAGLPPTLLIVGSSELLLDDSTRYACLAGNATLEVWHDMPHVFPAIASLNEAKLAVQGMARFLRSAFEEAESR